MAVPLILDISSIISEEKSLSSLLSVASIIEKSNALQGIVIIVAIAEDEKSKRLISELQQRDLRFIEVKGSASSIVDLVPENAHFISDDPLLIAKLGDKHSFWDHDDITKYSSKSLSSHIGFPHSAMTLYSLLCGSNHYHMTRLDNVMSEEAIRICQRYPTANALLEAPKDELPISISNNIGKVKERAIQLKKFITGVKQPFDWMPFALSLKREKDNSERNNDTNSLKEVYELEKLYDITNSQNSISIFYEKDRLILANEVQHISCEISDKLSLKNIFDIIYEKLASANTDVYAFNSKNLRKALMQEGLVVPKINDISTLAYLGNNLNKSPDLNSLLNTELNVSIERGAEDSVTPEEIMQLPRLFEKMYDSLTQTQKRYYDEIEIPFLNVVSEMENSGMKVDIKRLHAAHQKCLNMLEHCNSFISDTLGENVDVSDRKVVESVLYDKLNLQRSDTLKRSTDADTLNYLSKKNPDYKPIINAISLALRQVTMMNNYTKKYGDYINPETGRIHGTINTTSTKTGRISCSDPNLMGIPKKSSEGKLIKSCFIAPDNMAIVKADYSQIELKILAHMSKEPVLVNGFKKGLDVHRATAGSVFDKAYEDVTEEERQAAKSINFGLIYGMQAKSLAQEINKSESEAKNYMEKYFNKLPRVNQFLNWVKNNAKRDGYIKTLFHRHINIEHIQSKNRFQVMAGERQASNAPMQSSAADIIKKAMVDLYNRKMRDNLGFNFVMQVHDEIILYTPLEEVELTRNALKEAMENAVNLDVPIDVDVEVSYNLASKSVDKDKDIEFDMAM